MSYFKCEHDRALTGSQGLTDEQFSVYWRSIFTMYSDGGPLEFDVQRLKHVFGKRPQDVRRIVGQLVDAGKMTLQNGFIHVPRVDFEIYQWNANDWSNEASVTKDMERHYSVNGGKNSNDPTHAPAITSDLAESLELRREAGAEERPSTAGDAAPASPHAVDDGSLRSGGRTPLIDAIRAKQIAEGRVPGTTTIAGSSLFERLNAAKGD